MSDIVRLATKPTAAEIVRQNVVEVLRDVLAQAEKGEIATIAMIIEHTNGAWSDRTSDTINFRNAIGHLEILKLEWIGQHLGNHTVPDDPA